MTPSFFSLFKRGQYCRPIPSEEADASDGAKNQREELERFVVAALAFAFKHDPQQFGVYFFDSVCSSTPTQVESIEGLDITIEDEDLDMVIYDRRRACVYIIEAKVNASLEPRQNPLDRFFASEGYGTKAEQKFRNIDHFRYIILGAHEQLNCSPINHKKNWSFCQRSWNDLAKGWPNSPIAKDLRNFLGDVHIAPFMIYQTEGIVMNTDLRNAAEANVVLTTACKALETESFSLDVAFEKESDHWHFGMNLDGSGKCGEILGKIAASLKMAKPCAWFGYEGKPIDAAIVWFYTADKTLADQLRKKLTDFPSETSPEGHLYVVKPADDNDASKHRDWFVSVFKAFSKL